MLLVVSIMFVGILAGWTMRKFVRLPFLDKSIFGTILLLLFLMGISVGGNPEIIDNLPRVGGQALLLAVLGTSGSVSAAWVVYRLAFSEKTRGCGKRGNDGAEADTSGPIPEPENAGTSRKESSREKSSMKGSLPILACFIIGCLAGYGERLPRWAMDPDLSLYVLYALMGQVGFSIGADKKLKEIVRTIRPRLLWVPVATWGGTFAFVAAGSFLLSRWSIADCLAVGSGFAYYSLSSILITQFKEASMGIVMATELGTIALVCNILRELLTIVGAPWMYRYFGKFAPICAGGATTMDTTLPIIAQVCGKEMVCVSIFHAIIVDFSVPFWVSLFCSI